MAKPGPRVDTLLYLLDQAFEGSKEHALLGNLRSVPHADWWEVPPGAARSVAAIAGHLGWGYYMYGDYAFGHGSLNGDDPLVIPHFLREPGEGNVEAVLRWLRDGFRRFRASVARLQDADLETLRQTTWGEPAETRWIVSEMVAHTLYHAGEINHLRALLAGEDRWAYEADRPRQSKGNRGKAQA